MTGLCHVAPLSVEKVVKSAPLPYVEVVPGNIHPPEEGRRWVVVRPTRLPVVATAVVNAEMGPAIRVRGIGGLVPAEAEAAALPCRSRR